jgi:hypothetical protein
MKVTKLRTKHARKPATKAKAVVVQGWNQFQPATGKNMIANLDGAMKNYKEQVKADRRAAALDRLAGF